MTIGLLLFVKITQIYFLKWTGVDYSECVFSYIACEIMLHLVRQGIEESPFVDELITRQLNETQWVCKLVVRGTIHTTVGIYHSEYN